MAKRVSGSTLLNRLKAVLGRKTNNSPQSILVADPLSKYFDTFPQSVIGFGPTLNDSPEFSPDKLGLLPKHLRNLKKTDTVGSLHEVIKKWYRANGWTVT